MRKILGLLIVALLPVLWLAAPSFQQAQVTRYVSNTSPTCNGQSPCHPTIQAAINAAQAGETIRIQAGTYTEAVLIKGKNAVVGATEADRIVIESDPTAPVDSVIVGTTATTCVSGTNLQIESSQFITIRGLTIAGGKRQALTLAGTKKKNTAIHIERNRILGNGTCKGGLLIGKDNRDILVVNNLIYGSSQHGVNVQQGVGGPHYFIGNTIHGNGKNGVLIGKDQNVWLVNNIVTGNGTDPKSAATDGFGVKRRVPKAKATPELAVLLHNLVCGNAGGELNGAMLDSSDAGNLTPLGSEGTGVSASPGCDNLATLYANLNGADAQPNTEDDDFTPADDSLAVDSGMDPRTLSASLPASSLEADFLSTAVRP